MSEPDAQPVIGKTAFIVTTLEIARATRSELAILSEVLEPAVYGSEAFVDAIKTFLLADPRARLRALIKQLRKTAQGGAHRLVELARRLPSRIALREPAAERPGEPPPCEWIIADRHALLERRAPDRLVASYRPSSPLLAREKLERYEQIWNEGVPARELQQLSI